MSPDQPSSSPPLLAPKFQIRSLIWSLYVPSFLLTLGQGLLIPILPFFARDAFGSSDVLVALMITARPFGMMMFDVPAGVLVGIFGLRRTMLGGILLFAIAAVIGGLSPSFGVLIIGRLMAGSSFALWSISRQVYIAQTVPNASRGKALSLFGGISRAAAIGGAVIGGILYDEVGIRAPFFAQIVIAALTGGIILVTMRGTTEAAAKSFKHNVFPGLGHTLWDNKRIFATAGMAAIMLQFMRAAREFILPVWADENGLSGKESGYIIGVMSAVDSVMFPVVGYIMDRWGRKATGVPAYIVFASGFAFIPFANSFELLMLVGVLVGIGNGLSSGLVLTMGVDMAPKTNPGEFLGVWRLISDAGGASGPAMIGGVASVLTLSAASVMTAGVGGLGAVILIFLVRETLVRDEVQKPAT